MVDPTTGALCALRVKALLRKWTGGIGNGDTFDGHVRPPK